MNYLNEVTNICKFLLEKYNPSNDFDGHVMLAFYFEDDYGIPKCHCTHKYLGMWPDIMEHIPDIIKVVNDFWVQVPKRDRVWNFDTLELFGKEQDVPVMRRMQFEKKFLDLKEMLDDIKPDDWPEYKPHVTLKKTIDEIDQDNLEPLIMRPTHYALAVGDEKYKTWPMIKEYGNE